MGLGGGIITLTLIIVRLSQSPDLARYGQAVSDASLNLLVGLFASIGLAAAFGWRRSRALENDWQRGVIAVLAAVGALVVGFIAAPIHLFLGIAGLVAWTAASIGFGIAGSKWATKGSGDGGRGTGPT